jgi:nucleolar GTP-binding protein
MKIDNQKIQIIDTPGLLERPLEKLNKIEMKAIIALKHLADLILFVFDPSESSGYKMTEQKKLHKKIKKLFPEKKMIIIDNKSDLTKKFRQGIKISCKTGEGINELKSQIFSYFFP